MNQNQPFKIQRDSEFAQRPSLWYFENMTLGSFTKTQISFRFNGNFSKKEIFDNFFDMFTAVEEHVLL
jgi:hypothetical protein